MKKALPGIYYIIPVLYVGVIGFFLFMQFHARERFEERVGALEVRGAYTKPLSGGKRIRELVVHCSGIQLRIGGGSVQLLESASARGRRFQALSVSRFDRGVEVLCSEELRLRFSLTDTDEPVALRVLLPERLKDYELLALPYRPAGDAAERVAGIPLLRLAGRAGIRCAALPEGSDIDMRKNLLILNLAGGEEASAAYFSRVGEGAEEPYLFWLSRKGGLVQGSEYGLRVQPYLDRSYRRWNRVLAAASSAPEAAGAPAVCLLSEALRRGEYNRVLPAAAAALRLAQQAAPGTESAWDGSAYTGTLREHWRRAQQEADVLLARITEAIQRGDPQVFGVPELMRFIVNRAPLSLAEEALRLADSVERPKAGLETLVGLLAAYVDAGRFIDNGAAARQRIDGLIDHWILPAVRWTQEGLFLAAPALGKEAPVDLLLCARAGRLLVHASRLSGRPFLETLGRNLILGVLSLADEEGLVPARAVVQAGRLQSRTGTLEPQALYPLASDAAFLPEEHPLYPELSPGAWLYTAAAPLRIQISEQRYRFTFSFPVGAAHYFIIQELPPMRGVLLHDIPWKPDPQYAQYSDGWVYDAGSQTLFGKITHRKAEEDLLLDY